MSSLKTSNGVWVPSRKTLHAVDDNPHVKKANLQIFLFNTKDIMPITRMKVTMMQGAQFFLP